MRGTRFPFEVRPRLPERLQRLQDLAEDLAYSWSWRTQGLFLAPEAPVEACAGCHMASAHEDMVFVGFYRGILTPLENDSMASGKRAR